MAEQPGEARAWSGRSIGVLWGWRICAACIRWFGRWPAYLLVTPILTYYYLVRARAQRRASREFLDRAAGPARGPRAWWRSYRQFHAFALSLVDRYLFLFRGPSAFHVAEEGRDEVDEVLARGRGLVLVTSHLGNADLAGAALSQDDGVTFHAVRVETERPEIRALFEAAGGQRLPDVIDLQGEQPATLRMLTALRAGDVVAMMGDRVVDGHWVEAPFLGRPAAFPAGPFLVAATAGVPLVVTFFLREGGARYRMVALPPQQPRFEPGRSRDEQVAAWVAAFAAELEARARRHPQQWFNFFSIWEPPELPPRRSLDRRVSRPRR